jgi:hypothetical protein
MNEAAKKRLEKMPREQQQRRYLELREKLGITNRQSLAERRAPSATREELKEAHGYAYGGAINAEVCGFLRALK